VAVATGVEVAVGAAVGRAQAARKRGRIKRVTSFLTFLLRAFESVYHKSPDKEKDKVTLGGVC